MGSGSILLAIALVAGVAFFVVYPLLTPRVRRRQDIVNPARQRLVAQKEELLNHLRSLDFDWETGKVPEDVYKQQSADLKEQAAAVLRRLDEIEPEAAAMHPLDDQIEAAVARQRRSVPPRRAPAAAPASVPATTSNGQHHAAAPGATRYCPQCGRPVDPDDRFCAACGHQLTREVTPKA